MHAHNTRICSVLDLHDDVLNSLYKQCFFLFYVSSPAELPVVCLGFGVPVPISRSGTERSGKGICSLAYSGILFSSALPKRGSGISGPGCTKGIIRERRQVHHLSGF